MNITACLHTHIATYTHKLHVSISKVLTLNGQLRTSLGALFYLLNHYTYAEILYVTTDTHAVT